MASSRIPAPLVSPAVAALKEEANQNLAIHGQMERSVSQDIREEREDLKKAAEQSINAIMELNLDGAIRWVSHSWEQLTGFPYGEIVGRKIHELISSDHKAIFADAIESMRRDDTKSRIIRFQVPYRGPVQVEKPRQSSDTLRVPTEEAVEDEEPVATEIALEAQGIMVYDRSTGEESHTMWMIKPAIPREITIDLPEMLVESLGIGAHVLAQYLTSLADVGGIDNPDAHPPPLPVLCRICERSITPWWFEKHTELCLQEHRAEMDIQLAHEALSDHRASIVKVLDALEAQAKRVRMSTSDGSPSPVILPEYKGHVIGPPSSTGSNPSTGHSSTASSGQVTPAQSHSRGRESSASGFGHHRARSFAVRRPLARIVELVLDLCDTAMEINTPAIKESNAQDGGEIRTQSPSSDSRISQVNQWQSPSSSTLENEEGLALLCDDTQTLCKAKVESVIRCRRILEYSERIRVEFDILVQECIDEALAKASRIAAGELSDASESSVDSEAVEDPISTREPSPKILEQPRVRRLGSNGPPHSLAMALRNASDTSLGKDRGRRESSAGASTRSNSPIGSRTPRSMVGSVGSAILQHKRSSVVIESDAGADSDSSFRSSLASASRRAESPGNDLSLSRVASARGRKRTSLALPSLQGGSRQESPVRPAIPPPLSPLRTFKPRVQSGESSGSPITSPMQSTSEFTSPIIRAQGHYHHRRQSSIALGEAYRNMPSSPRLNAISSAPQPKAVQTSIKDFEIIKPISKGAFGSVYLAKKKITGDYYAIKVLKKGDMVAKNQITNVKAERAIMMWQGESDFVAKLYWTFSSKDYLYLVMEYLNGGDCASLIKTLGGLPEDWAKKYIGEVVLGVQHLHSRQIVHRDLKPDNLLIDQKGHLKLTDFGLSRMGLVGRQKRMQNGKPNDLPDLSKHNPFRRAPSVASSRSTSFDFNGQHSPNETPLVTTAGVVDSSQPSYFSLNRDTSREARRMSIQRSDSGDSDVLQAMFRRFSLADENLMPPAQPAKERQTTIDEETASDDADSPDAFTLQSLSSSVVSHPGTGTPPQQAGMPPPPMALFDPEDHSRRFVGTPDYLAPETINGIGQDEMSDWWSLGCILFECLYGFPPFHASTPEIVFQNILARNIHWPDPEEDIASEEAKDLINKLLELDPKERLGSNKEDKYENGGDEVRAHSWFADIEWDSLREDEASFVPQPAHVEDTEYFDARGATNHNFSAEFEDQATSPSTPGGDYQDRPHDALSRVRMKVNSIKRGLMPLHIPPHVRDGRTRRSSEPTAPDDFGNFQFKNLPILEKANKDVLSKLRAEAMQAQSKSSQGIMASQSGSSSAVASTPSLEASPVIQGPIKRALSISKNVRPVPPLLLNQMSSSPGRPSQPSSPLLVSFSASNHERRKTSSGSSSLSQQLGNTLQPGSFFDMPKLTKTQSAVSSPIKIAKSGSSLSQSSNQDGVLSPPTMSSPRQRSHTIGSNDDEMRLNPTIQSKRRSQVLDVSPSSSDTEDTRQRVLLRVQRRRQSSRRLSQITLSEGPFFRPLDVLICEDHPVSRLVMERLLEKLRCRTISVTNGFEAMRYATSEVKFDIIMMEFKLPHINGADVARMIRETRNANTNTPIVAVTGYLKELQAPHDFDALIEKPPDTNKLSDVLGRLCMWKPPPPGWTPALLSTLPGSNLRKGSMLADDSPTSTAASAVFSAPGNRVSSREDSITSGSMPDSEHHYERIPVIIAGQAGKSQPQWNDAELEKQFGALGISGNDSSGSDDKLLTPRPPDSMPELLEQHSAPAALETASRKPGLYASPQTMSTESLDRVKEVEKADAGDDEDDELGNVQIRAKSPRKMKPQGSKLATQMLRTNSRGSVVSGDELGPDLDVRSVPRSSVDLGELDRKHLTPPIESQEFGEGNASTPRFVDTDMTPRPQQSSEVVDTSSDPTPRKPPPSMRKVSK